MTPCELLVLRHGQAENSNPGGDFERALTRKGTQAAAGVGAWLADNDCRPERVYCSPAARARLTVGECLRVAGRTEHAVNFEPRIYNASIHALIEVLAEVPADTGRVLLVGHNPGLGYLVGSLAREHGPRTDPYYQLRPATLVRLRLARAFDDLNDRCAEVVDRVHP